ncbi:MAG: hypothetical protein ACE5MM_03890 [Nitrospiraceae bacterium]
MYRCLILALILTGCASSQSTFARPADVYNPNPVEYPSYYDALSADLFWRCMTPEVGGVTVAGYAVASTRENLPINNFQVTLYARDAKGNELAKRWTYGDILSPSQSQPVPFQISVPATEGVARYDLYYAFAIPGERRRQREGKFGTVEEVCGSRWRRKPKPPAS